MPSLTLAHSPDADDLVMWWPLTGMRTPAGEPVEGPLGTPRVDTGGFEFRLVGEDVEKLNQMVTGAGGAYDLTAISAAAYPLVKETYRITACGGSFGEGYGPKVVVREDSPIRETGDLRGKSIAVPGTRTSAFLTLSMMLGQRGDRGFRHEAMLFSDVPRAVTGGRCDAGLLIHEAQLTFGEMGLRKVVDLGEWWATRHDLPLPLGLNVVRRDVDARFGPGTCERVSELLAESVRYAVEHADESHEYLLLHSADRKEWHDRELVRRYLGMYVSRMSLDMGERGREALGVFLAAGHGAGFCDEPGEIDVV